MRDATELEELEVRLVLEAIHARYGYDFRAYTPDAMRRRLQALLVKTGLPHFGELQHRLLVDPELFASLVGELTVQVTEMFRDPDFYRTFRERVVPLLRTYPELKLWHAGCSSGEEVYATAILLREESLHARSQIYATDLSLTALEQAREGVYSEADIVEFGKNYVAAGGKARFEDYYSRGYGRFAVRETLRENVVFFQHDLGCDQALGEMHVIFCRNVLIYFGPSLRERAYQTFRAGLYRGGFLCLGASESLPSTQLSAFDEFAAEDRIFRRRGES